MVTRQTFEEDRTLQFPRRMFASFSYCKEQDNYTYQACDFLLT
jgi:hypothetical protein